MLIRKNYNGTLSIDERTILIEDRNSRISFDFESLITVSMRSEQEAHAQEMCCDIERVKIVSPELADKIRISVLTSEISFQSTVDRSEADKLATALNANFNNALEEAVAQDPKLKRLLAEKGDASDYPFHLHINQFDRFEEEEPPTGEEWERLRLEWKDALSKPFVGTCDLCREITALSREADQSYLLCEKCAGGVSADLGENEKVSCDFCRSKQSRLLGELQPSGKFKCLMCLPEGVCMNCEKTGRLVTMARDWRGMLLFCAECS